MRVGKKSHGLRMRNTVRHMCDEDELESVVTSPTVGALDPAEVHVTSVSYMRASHRCVVLLKGQFLVL